MKRILLFVVAAVLLPIATASADLMVNEYVTGEKVTLDDVTGKYWYWNLNDFVNRNYSAQISAIAAISPTYGNIAGGWHMASLSEMTALWTYSETNIKAAFGSALGTGWDIVSMGRVNASASSGYHRIAGEWYGSWIFPSSMWHDGRTESYLGAWVTTDATVVPVPPSVVLATTGMMTGLLCMLGAKLRGRRRYGPSSIIESR